MMSSPTDSLSQADVDVPWWECKTKTKALPKAQRLFKFLSDQDRHRLGAYTGYSRLYTNRDIMGNDYLRNYTAAFSLSINEYSRVPLNLAKVMVDAVHARVTRPAVAVEFLPAGGNWSLRKKARQATSFIRQQNHQYNLRQQQDAAELDSLIYGLGAIKTTPHPVIEQVENFRVHPRDIFVDPVEAASGTVTHLYQRQFVSRGRLKKLFPKNARTIEKANRLTDRTSTDWNENGQTMQSNMVEIVEGWKLPSWPGAGDGRKIIFINGAALDYCEWKEADFPFSFCYWKRDPTLGFFGISLVEELIGLHFDVNTSLLHVEQCIEAMPKPYILVPQDGEVNEGQLGNVPGIIINHSTSAPPSFVMPPSVPADVVNYIDKQWQRGLQVAKLVALGMPESAGGQAETGAAFDTIVDIQSTELAPAFKEREDFLVRVAEQQMVGGRMLDLRLKAEGKPGYRTVLRKDRNTIEQVEWKNFELDPRNDCFVIQAMPASALAQTFAGRLAQVKEMVGLGLIPLSRAFKLLDIPDLDSEMRIQNASLDFIEMVIEAILDEGEYTPPEPTMDLRLALKVTQKNINLAQAMGVEDDRVTMLYDFLRGVSDLIASEQRATREQAAGMAPGVAGGPPAQDISGASPGAASLQGNVMGQIG